MILCTKCLEGKFSGGTRNKLVCSACGFEIPIHDNLIVFHPEDSDSHDGMTSCLYDEMIKVEEDHFVIRAKRSFLGSVFEKYVSRTDSIIEVGAGTGSVASYLMKNGYKNISTGEVHLKGLEYAKSYGIKDRYQFDLTKAPFSEHFDVVLICDVLEHIDDDDLAVKNIYRMLKEGGKVIATVPTHMWLWSKQDAIVCHRRRYEVYQLEELFIRNNFKILKVGAFFISILPFLYLRKIIDRDDGIIKEGDLKNRFHINPIINFVLGKMLNLEIELLSNTSLKYGWGAILVGSK